MKKRICLIALASTFLFSSCSSLLPSVKQSSEESVFSSAIDVFSSSDLNISAVSSNENSSGTSNERFSNYPNDLAIKVANIVSVFPEVGDEVDMSEYITFNTGTNYKLGDFTFTSSNQQVIQIVDGYKASCIGQGYTAIAVSGPGLNTPVEISFYVGSIAGHYVPDSRALSGVISLDIVGSFTDGYTFTLNVTSNGRQYNKRDIVNYDGSGTLIKNLSPFVPMQFNGEAPSSFEPIANYLLDLLSEDASQFKDVTEDVYGFMSAEPEEGILIKMRFNNTFITLVNE